MVKVMQQGMVMVEHMALSHAYPSTATKTMTMMTMTTTATATVVAKKEENH